MRRTNKQIALAALFGMLGLTGFGTPLRAETGSVAVVFTKGASLSGWVGSKVC